MRLPVAALLQAVHEAGDRVMAIYRGDAQVIWKADDSPLTAADLAAHDALVQALAQHTPGYPVVSEEAATATLETRRSWSRYWLIDPLDGTKEFLKHNGEFTLNVALIEAGVPVFGIVHAPALPAGPTTWWGSAHGAFKQVGAGVVERIGVRVLPDPAAEAWIVVGSRSHATEAVEAFCAGLPAHRRASLGSSLKLCLVAEGRADLYPRLAPTCEWDTAAAQAVVLAAGGEVLEAETLAPLRCTQGDSYVNPAFIVCAQRDARWESALRRAL
ncbi:3'(2'),5'-bisphosphate nucleotidase [Salinicola endophyticus]|uniref:3'(2'),5'-bisphosphate nucleotidase CysQ n=2 Tax=Halomonadaceae TaxID=28256 RepID=A0ABY8FLK3_9GAMM|nr:MULTISPECIES: 3'(2'),5'-bisphosphate nucleotidase CysQ [Salinicola]WFF43681.1 3'(2'),5'-bisphosphate nucleotidase [Salinicola endophyticus]